VTATLDRVLVAADAGRVTDGKPADPDPEVPERARRRTFTAKYKLEVLAAYEAAEPGEKGAILRREGLYSSHIVEWRRARDAGALGVVGPPPGRQQPPWPSPAAASSPIPGTRRSPGFARRSNGWSRSWPRPAS
jgi:hypothetical protein